MPTDIPAHPDGATMKAVCFSAFGKDPKEALELKTIPKPFLKESDEDKVLVKVYACALNPIDKIRLSGGLSTLLPEAYADNVLGYDVSGVVEETTRGNKKFSVGDEVFVRLSEMSYGALSEYVVCGNAEVGTKPKSLSFVQAAAVPLAGLTALQALRKAGVTKGSKVLIPAGSGGVGSLGIQIAKKVLGASYVATTASPGRGTEICTEMGADRVVDYRSETLEEVLAGEDFDAIFDTTDEGHKIGPLLKKGGKVVSIAGAPTIEAITHMGGGKSPGMMVRFLMFMIRNRKAEKAAKGAGGTWDYIFMKPDGEALDELAKYLEDGSIAPVIDTEAVGLENYSTAVEKLWSGRSKGKCVIKVVV
mmetsp:Transcript_7866/g.16208  ORF Transcript_7866/g.16208 Transcript_7866/m.16208 type:complete len:362 (-) Transcript_7866:147-1232(-)|eukprot:CAMPEP_0201125466 /NCGR_PEP_ID=MMETSP0850-20130426/21592_1 /ASSEMBLY_ACC=CAM_ASM_000622 /TAXON_ID=183588 /ORGANISM="Pseudo-nitzschia fraudulenta, Strain WWA7" /LENGTH=361 /DNA_ID=CAMNT_0047393515 /DNA_START=207 /DNA_END=1292 /DNA_ORIENTATION=-